LIIKNNLFIYLNENEFRELYRKYNRARIYKIFHNYKKSIRIYKNLINEFLEVEKQVNLSLEKNNILDNGLRNKTYNIKKDSLKMFLLLELFKLYIKDKDINETKNSGNILLNCIKEYGYTNLPNHFKKSMNRTFKKCKDKELLMEYENKI